MSIKVNGAALAQPGLDRRAIAGPALRAFFKIAEAWKLTAEQQMTLLGVTATATYYNWRNGKHGALPKDTIERLSYIFGIYKALNILFSDPSAADGWIKRPNSAAMFGGRSALDVMLSGNVVDLYRIRQYLDAQRGGWA